MFVSLFTNKNNLNLKKESFLESSFSCQHLLDEGCVEFLDVGEFGWRLTLFVPLLCVEVILCLGVIESCPMAGVNLGTHELESIFWK